MRPALRRGGGLAALVLVADVSSTLYAEGPPATTAAAAPRISVDPARFDFGRVLVDRSVDKEFVIRNLGRADLLISEVSTSCNCTVADGWAKRIAPGRTTPLRVTLRAGSSPGRVVRSVLVKSNDPVRPTLEIQVEATVVAPAARAPAQR